jgi:hypothetical protein
MNLSRSGFELNEIWERQVNLVEADTRLRAHERAWAGSGSHEDAHAWGREALRAGHHPLHVAHRLLSNGHHEAVSALAQDAHPDARDQLEIAPHIHKFIESAKHYKQAGEAYVAQRKKEREEEPENYRLTGRQSREAGKLGAKWMAADEQHDKSRRTLRTASEDQARQRRQQEGRTLKGDPLWDTDAEHAVGSHIVKWPHASDHDRVKMLARYNGFGHKQKKDGSHTITRPLGANEKERHFKKAAEDMGASFGKTTISHPEFEEDPIGTFSMHLPKKSS